MDMISQLPDELLLKILSLLPSTKHVVNTMVLSKRWEFLWMMVPKLVYDYRYHNIGIGRSLRCEYGRFSRFVDRSLFRHEAPVIETLHFKLSQVCASGDIRVWIRDADKRCVRELIIDIDTHSFAGDRNRVTLPKSLYTCCRMLVTLKLSNAVFVDDFTSPISFPSLKKLSLKSMEYASHGFVDKLLSGCPVLEDLVVDLCGDDNVALLSVRVPSLKSLFLHKSENKDINHLHGFLIDTPSLECLHIIDHYGWFCFIESNMPMLEKVILDVSYSHPGNILGCITSVKHLDLCLSSSFSEIEYPVNSVFGRLVNLRVCTCETEWLNLLMRVLGDSPNLRALKLEQCHENRAHKLPLRPRWSEPRSVPRRLLSSLESFEWVDYEGAKEEKEVAAFILSNANCLKQAIIISSIYTHCDKKLEMLKELASWPRCSPTCQLLFD